MMIMRSCGVVKMVLLGWIAFLAVVVGGVSASVYGFGGAVHTVCTNVSEGCDYTSIQDAVDAASDGDTIKVWAGTYTENVDVNKSVNLRGAGADVTVVNALNDDFVISVTADNVNISGFTVMGGNGSSGWAGIKIENSDYSRIFDNLFTSNYNGFYSIRSNHNKITNNIFYQNSNGIFLAEFTDFTVIRNNNVSGNKWSGIVVCSNNNTILDNIIQDNERAIGLSSANYNLIYNNTIINNSRWDGAILLESSFGVSSNFNNISYNKFNKNRESIYISLSHYNIVSHNIINSSQNRGIVLYAANNSFLTNNDITFNGFLGINIIYSNSTEVAFNNIIKNGEEFGDGGVKIMESSINNTIYHNNFINNTNQAYDYGNNTWDSGYPSGGNYWSDWTSPDNYSGEYQNESGSDGIVDVAYNVGGVSNQDRYPFVNENGWNLSVGGGGPGPAHISVCPSGCNFSTIQSAIDAASDGDTIKVWAGTYNENVDVNKSVNLRGAGADVTVVNASDPGDHVFEVTADGVNISGFTILGSSESSGIKGLYLYNVTGCNISTNNFSGTGNESGYGIYLDRSRYCEITNNNLSKWSIGIFLVQNSSFNNLSNNEINNNDVAGIQFYWNSDYNLVYKNTINSNLWGIDVGTPHNNITSNTITSNSGPGIRLTRYSIENLITLNYIKNNSYYGIYFVPSCGSPNTCIDNEIYHNNFINNSPQSFDVSNNTWDNGYPLGGNYWDDYDELSEGCSDFDSDGICDWPYNIGGGDNQDRYPFTTESGWLRPDVECGYIRVLYSGGVIDAPNGSKWKSKKYPFPKSDIWISYIDEQIIINYRSDDLDDDGNHEYYQVNDSLVRTLGNNQNNTLDLSMAETNNPIPFTPVAGNGLMFDHNGDGDLKDSEDYTLFDGPYIIDGDNGTIRMAYDISLHTAPVFSDGDATLDIGEIFELKGWESWAITNVSDFDAGKISFGPAIAKVLPDVGYPDPDKAVVIAENYKVLFSNYSGSPTLYFFKGNSLLDPYQIPTLVEPNKLNDKIEVSGLEVKYDIFLINYNQSAATVAMSFADKDQVFDLSDGDEGVMGYDTAWVNNSNWPDSIVFFSSPIQLIRDETIDLEGTYYKMTWTQRKKLDITRWKEETQPRGSKWSASDYEEFLNADIWIYSGNCESCPHSLTWLPPISLNTSTNPGDTVPIKFTLNYTNGSFAVDESVLVEVYNATGDPVFNATYGEGDDDVTIDPTGQYYVTNVYTSKTWPEGSYTVKVSFDDVLCEFEGQVTLEKKGMGHHGGGGGGSGGGGGGGMGMGKNKTHDPGMIAEVDGNVWKVGKKTDNGSYLIDPNTSDLTHTSLEIMPLDKNDRNFVNRRLEIKEYSALPEGVGDVGIPDGGGFLGAFVSAKIKTVFNEIGWVVIKINYTDEKLENSSLDEDSLGMAWYDEENDKWITLSKSSPEWVNSAGINKEENYLWVNVSHLSLYGVIGELTPEAPVTPPVTAPPTPTPSLSEIKEMLENQTQMMQEQTETIEEQSKFLQKIHDMLEALKNMMKTALKILGAG